MALSLRPMFTWKFSGPLIPFFFGMGYAAMTNHQFVMAYVLSVLGGIWALCYYFYSDSRKKRANTVVKLREAARKHEAAEKVISKYKRARAWHYCKDIGTYAGVCLATAAFLFWLYLGQKEYELLLPDGWLRPANEPTPANACTDAPEGSLKILLGNFSTAYTVKFPATIISINDNPVLTLDRNQNGEVAITTDIYDQNDNIVTEIEKNKFKIDKDVFDHPRPDFSRLTVVIKHKKEKVLDIYYLNPSAIQIFGIFRIPGNPALGVTPSGLEFGNQKLSGSGSCSGNNAGASFAFRGSR